MMTSMSNPPLEEARIVPKGENKREGGGKN
jgi:hypothetical protein